MSLRDHIVGQFRQPIGPVGMLAGWIMANRASNRQRNAWMVELLDVGPGDRILEIGCGPGLALDMCAQRLVDGQATGIDHSATMLAQARRRNRRHIASGQVVLRHGDLASLDDQAGPFDAIMSANVVQFLPDRQAAFERMLLMLAPGGLIATTHQPRDSNPTNNGALAFAGSVADCMAEAGFDGIRTELLPLEPVPAVCVLGTRPG